MSSTLSSEILIADFGLEKSERAVGYNYLVNFKQKLLSFFLILFPLGIVFLIPISPFAAGYLEASHQVKNAYLSGEAAVEIEYGIKLLQFSPWRGDLWQRAGRLYMNNGDLEEAIDAFKHADTLGQLDSQGKVWLADALLGLDEKDQAKEVLRGVSAEQDVFILMQTAALQRRINDTFGALNTLLSAYSLDSKNCELNYQLGIQLAAQEPDSAGQYLQVALTDVRRQREAQVLLDLLDNTKDIAGSVERFIYIGQALAQIEEWDVAARAFQQAVDLDPDHAIGQALLAEALQQMGEDGFPALKKAMELDPDGEMVNGLVALYFNRQGKPEVALEYLKRALEANPSAVVWEIETANVLAQMGELEDALKHYQMAIQMDESNWVAWKALAVFSISRNYEVNTIGLNAARKALLLYPNSPALLDLMGTGLMLLGDLDSAERYFLQADALDPDQAAILIHLGQVHIYSGEREIAFGYLRRAAEVAEESRLRDMANRLLIENGGK